jgi:hypothetical protein
MSSATVPGRFCRAPGDVPGFELGVIGRQADRTTAVTRRTRLKANFAGPWRKNTRCSILSTVARKLILLCGSLSVRPSLTNLNYFSPNKGPSVARGACRVGARRPAAHWTDFLTLLQARAFLLARVSAAASRRSRPRSASSSMDTARASAPRPAPGRWSGRSSRPTRGSPTGTDRPWAGAGVGRWRAGSWQRALRGRSGRGRHMKSKRLGVDRSTLHRFRHAAAARPASAMNAFRVRFSHPLSHRTPHYRVGNGATERSADRQETHIFQNETVLEVTGQDGWQRFRKPLLYPTELRDRPTKSIT